MLSDDEVWELMDDPSRHGELVDHIRAGRFDVDFDEYRNRHFEGQTLVRLAVHFDAEDVAIALLERGADPRIEVPGVPFVERQADPGVPFVERPVDTPFHYAIGSGMVQFVVACLDRYPSLLNAEVRTGGRPIQWAVHCRPPNLELVQLLVDRGADLNFKIDKKYTFELYMKELWKPQPSRMDAYEPILKILGYR